MGHHVESGGDYSLRVLELVILELVAGRVSIAGLVEVVKRERQGDEEDDHILLGEQRHGGEPRLVWL